jgi:predicted nucleic acid-binding protein
MPAEFLDTNILVYAHDRSAEHKFTRARALIEQLWVRDDGILSTQVLQEFYVTVTTKIPNPILPLDARRIVSDFATWTVAVVEMPDILRAGEMAERYRLNFWDGLILAAAYKEEATIIWSEDFRHGQKYGEITVLNPFAQ